MVSKVHDHFDNSNRPLTYSLKDKRSLDANAQVWVWIPKIAEFSGWTIPETEKFLKLNHALPILLTDQEQGSKIRFILDKCEFDLMTEEGKANMVHFLPVTRLFSTKQHNSYRDSIQVYYASQGLMLDYLN